MFLASGCSSVARRGGGGGGAPSADGGLGEATVGVGVTVCEVGGVCGAIVGGGVNSGGVFNL